MADITALCKRVLLIHEGQLMYDGDLDHLLERFAPYREVKIELAKPVMPEKLAEYGEIEALEGQEVRFLVKRAILTQAIAKMLAELELLDLSVNDPPIEDIIGRLFLTGTLNH